MSRPDLTVIGGEGGDAFKGEAILRAAADFVDVYCPYLNVSTRAQMILDAAKVIVDAEIEL